MMQDEPEDLELAEPGEVRLIDRRVLVPAELAGRRLDQAAATLLPEFSRSRLKLWIESGELTVNGERGEPKQRVGAGDSLALQAQLEAVVEVAPEAIPLELVHRDDAIFVVNKPAGLVVHPGAGNRSGTLQNALLALDAALAALPRAGIVHRLDKDTSGLLVVARTPHAHGALAAQLERREMRRTYQAVCQGVLTGGGLVDAPLGRHSHDRTRMAVRERGRPARTRYRVLQRFRAHTHIELELETGRTHQIRVHMAHIRAPLVGDPAYGGRPRLPRAPSPLLQERLRAFRRQALHATRLALTHPETGAPLSFESALPADFAALLEALCADLAAARDDG